MAIVILGGLATSTLLNLFVCPSCTCRSAATAALARLIRNA
jgi:Cu/Ag efflux pump CusA